MNNLEIDPFETAHLLSPYGFQRALRDAGPLVWLPTYKVYATGHYSVAREVLNDAVHFTSGEGVGILSAASPTAGPMPTAEHAGALLHPSRNPILEVDPPQHARVRRLVEAVLPATRVKQIAGATALHTQQLLDHLGPAPRIDAVGELALPLALGSFPDSYGLQTADRGALITLGELAMNSLGPRTPHVLHSVSGAGPLKGWMREHLAPDQLAKGSIGNLLWAAASEIMDPAAAQDLVNTVLVSGVDTTLSALSTTLHCLAAHPHQWQRLRAAPSLAPRAFEEAMRLEAPIQMCYRTVATDTVLAGEHLKRGQKIMVHLGAASRDGAVFSHPEVYDIQRNDGVSLAFGAGLHRCVGRAIAHAQSQAVIEVLLQRISTLALLEPASFSLNNTLRRPSAVWLATTPAQARA